ncbi:uncharacterized protein LOC133727936 [Rosa rugosa]|uniref:uncharacterized protein LOC133727936 n=1 Tax=Rosa rugosa TaxID=74645 RepID=UPI002B401788|nr:uncharacterized protein LOC133727936 [Rosa rugosa]
MDCPHATEIWTQAGVRWSGGNVDSIQAWVMALIPTLSKEELNKVLMLLWGIWKNRNAQVWEQKGKHASDTLLLTLGWYEEYKKYHVVSRRQRPPPSHWIVPAPGQYKMNCDGAYQASSRRGGGGYVMRDSAGSFIAGQTKPYGLLTSPFHAELLALRDCILLARSLHHEEVVFESDCSLLVQAIHSPSQDLTTMNILIEEVRQLLQDHRGYSVLHVRREANIVAHTLATHALRSRESQVWFVLAPELIRDAIRNDVIVI